jgi:sulfoxide reductase heme-binding subunit YedZ
VRVIFPWNDRRGFSPLKASAFALMFVPGLWLIHHLWTGEFGPLPRGPLVYWSGVWAMAVLLLALAVTPAMKLFRWKRLMLVRRMIGVTGLFYSLVHIVMYFALREFDFPAIGFEMVTRVSLIIATVATIGLIPLGVTSVDYAVRRMGAERWQRLHNLVYAVTGLALFHYLLSPDVYPDQFFMTGIFLWLIVWRFLEKRGRGHDARALFALTLFAALFTALFEAGWTWAYQDFEPLFTLSTALSTNYGFPPSWKVAILFLIVTFAAMLRRPQRGAPVTV